MAPLSHRRDEIGHLSRTVNYLLATVESTLRSHHDFLADTSHELRNPLLAIRTNLELMERVPTREAREECLREALQQVHRMSRLVGDLLTLSRLESGYILDRHPLSLRVLLEGVTREMERLAGGRHLRLQVVREAEVLGDEVRLTQVFANLVDNALRHTPPGGFITLRLDSFEGWARVAVEDTGEGIPPEHLPHLFERFYRVGRASASGTGLGLAIVKHLCEAHGGRVTAESEPGRGSRFTVWLPPAGSAPDGPPAHSGCTRQAREPGSPPGVPA